jgi:glucan-binding YG repeat protein
VDPSQSIISLSSDNEPFTTEKTLTTVTFTTKTSHVPAKTCPPNKLTRKSFRNAKQPILAPKDKPSSNSQASTISSPQLISRKRQNTTTLESNTKKKKKDLVLSKRLRFLQIHLLPPHLSSTLALLKRHLAEPSLKQPGKARERWFQISQHLFWTQQAKGAL